MTRMLLPLAAGALMGPSVLHVADVPLGSTGAQIVFTAGVAAILFHGGLHLSVGLLRRVSVSLGMLAVPGVLLTAAVTGVAARVAFDLSWGEALLLGAVLAPTDPAIIIPLFLESRLRPKVAQTVVAESALNDVTGAVLACAFAAVVAGHAGVGLVVTAVIYAGAFLAGFAIHAPRGFEERLAHVATLLVFLLVGANLPFGAMGGHLLAALAVLAALLLVARPLTVVLCTLPDRAARWTRSELAFMCWTRETGVVPAALVGVLAGLDVPRMDVFATVVAVAILVTLAVQALPAPWLAGRLGLLDRPD